MITKSAIEMLLRSALPPSLHNSTPQLAHILANLANGQLTEEEAQEKISQSKSIADAFELLSGRHLSSNNTALSFGNSNQFGDVTIEDIAGNNITKFSVNIYYNSSKENKNARQGSFRKPEATSNENDLMELLILLEEAGFKSSRSRPSKYELDQYYVLKNEIMSLIHYRYYGTDRLQYVRIPFIRRCIQCKKKADVLAQIDTSKSWDYHLNMLPRCPNDTVVPEKAIIEVIVSFPDNTFAFQIPESKTILWNQPPQILPERQWIPHKDFKETRPPRFDFPNLGDYIVELKRKLSI
jgi:hypothetical protein